MNFVKRFLACLLLLTGCAAPARVAQEKTPLPPAVANPSHPIREVLIYIPQTDDTAAAAIKRLAKDPHLRLVVATSPRFLRLNKDPQLKAEIQSLLKEGRLDLALQIPNAPILPLLVNTDSARSALPVGSELPTPSYAYPEDVTQLVAQSKADFFKQWTFLPHGIVLPYGAASSDLLSLLNKLGFTWAVAAIDAPAVDGPYQMGSLAIWNATPIGQEVGTRVRVWDERQEKSHPLEAWAKQVTEENGVYTLPEDNRGSAPALDSGTAWKPRTWGEATWSLWIGQPAKNSAWDALRKTREALEVYKNSGQASVQRLDAAFSEIYSAQNSNYFASMGSTTQSPMLVEERQHEFQATLASTYRLIGQQPPDDLFQATAAGTTSGVRLSSTTTHAEVLPDGREHVQIQDAVGDAMGPPGAPDLQALDVWSSSESTRWVVTLTSPTPALVDIYVDLNGQPNAGTPTLLPGRRFTTSPIDAWEYAITLSGHVATLYRTQGAGTFGIVQTFPVVAQGNDLEVTIPAAMMHGSPKRWGYQVLVMTGEPTAKGVITDFIDPLDISQKEVWEDFSAGKRTDIPFIRIRSK